jgi:hypothetical protein
MDQANGFLHRPRIGQVKHKQHSSRSADLACSLMASPWSVSTFAVRLGAVESKARMAFISFLHRFGLIVFPRADMRRIRTAIKSKLGSGRGSTALSLKNKLHHIVKREGSHKDHWNASFEGLMS